MLAADSTDARPPRARRWPFLLGFGAFGLAVGLAITYIVVRPAPAPSVFAGQPSVTKLHLPAGRRATPAATPAVATLPIEPAIEPATAQEALQTFLAAEAAGDEDTAFSLLDAKTKDRVGTPAAWLSTRANRLVASTYTITGQQADGDKTDFVVTAQRTPSVTPFSGLVPASSTDGWVVSAAPYRVNGGAAVSVDPQLPTDASAVETASNYVHALVACDTAAFTAIELRKDLLGDPDLRRVPCSQKTTAWKTAGLRPLSDLPNATPLVAAYGPSVGRWARAVEIDGGTSMFFTVLAPLGNDWRVIGLLSSGRVGQ